MSCPNPTHDPQVVPVDLPDPHLTILRGHLADCIVGVSEDLKKPERLSDVDGTTEDLETYQRLLRSVKEKVLLVPDESARLALVAIAASNDRESKYREVVAQHDALHGLLALLEPETTDELR